MSPSPPAQVVTDGISTAVGALAVWLESRNPDDTTIAVRIEVGFGEACGKEFLVPLGVAEEPTSYLLFVSMGLVTGRWMFEARRAVLEPVPEDLRHLRKLRIRVPYPGVRTDLKQSGLQSPSGAIVGLEHGLSTPEECRDQKAARAVYEAIAGIARKELTRSGRKPLSLRVFEAVGRWRLFSWLARFRSDLKRLSGSAS